MNRCTSVKSNTFLSVARDMLAIRSLCRRSVIFMRSPMKTRGVPWSTPRKVYNLSPTSADTAKL